MKILSIILIFSLSLFADSNDTYSVLTPTTNDAFNYFFSIPIWFSILSIPMYLIFQLVNRWFK